MATLPPYATSAYYESLSATQLASAFNDLLGKSVDWLKALPQWAATVPNTAAATALEAAGKAWDGVADLVDKAKTAVGLPAKRTALGFVFLIPALEWMGAAAVSALAAISVRHVVIAACAAMGYWIYNALFAVDQAKAERQRIETAKENAIARASAENDLRTTLKQQGYSDAEIAQRIKQMNERDPSLSDRTERLLEKGMWVAAGVVLLSKYL